MADGRGIGHQLVAGGRGRGDRLVAGGWGIEGQLVAGGWGRGDRMVAGGRGKVVSLIPRTSWLVSVGMVRMPLPLCHTDSLTA